MLLLVNSHQQAYGSPIVPKKSPIISPDSRFESGFYTRRFGPHEIRYLSGFENGDSSRFRGIRRKNHPKRFQIENDSEKRGYHSGDFRHESASFPMTE